METKFQPWSLGSLVALIVFIVALILGLTKELEWSVAGLIMALAIARLV